MGAIRASRRALAGAQDPVKDVFPEERANKRVLEWRENTPDAAVCGSVISPVHVLFVISSKFQ